MPENDNLANLAADEKGWLGWGWYRCTGVGWRRQDIFLGVPEGQPPKPRVRKLEPETGKGRGVLANEIGAEGVLRKSFCITLAHFTLCFFFVEMVLAE